MANTSKRGAGLAERSFSEDSPPLGGASDLRLEDFGAASCRAP
jgi:hypothetical protein